MFTFPGVNSTKQGGKNPSFQAPSKAMFKTQLDSSHGQLPGNSANLHCPFWDGENVTLQKAKSSDLQPRDQARSWLESHGVLRSFLTNFYLVGAQPPPSYPVAHFARHLVRKLVIQTAHKSWMHITISTARLVLAAKATDMKDEICFTNLSTFDSWPDGKKTWRMMAYVHIEG